MTEVVEAARTVRSTQAIRALREDGRLPCGAGWGSHRDAAAALGISEGELIATCVGAPYGRLRRAG